MFVITHSILLSQGARSMRCSSSKGCDLIKVRIQINLRDDKNEKKKYIMAATAN